jgi:hypothetical protein
MNYSEPIFAFILCAALIDWFFWGHKRFAVPTKRSVFAEEGL